MRIPGELVVLRDFGRADLAAYAEWLRPGHEWQRLDGPYHPDLPETEIAERVAWLRARVADSGWPSPRTRLAVALPDTDVFIGSVSRYWIGEETRRAALGIDLYDPRHWGRGLGYEALGLWTEEVFASEPRFVRLDLRTWSGNLRMMRLAEKLGFRLEARFRRARVVDGRHYDALGYGVLRSEWEERHRGGFRRARP